ncbi:hypothetical protein RQP53_10535 [Paucibacter sp. APW11]|uniref:Uncharacterized protein n=1 Tax=Roseateles aquae TaxID=3077235 RepID=A0ABU3PB09_9BURK|nr:hypothetical protein [Paucibacter sp. APW11]MDT8999703.1 hypothetical protein [Paucibacter sp. APW11]
MMGYLRGFLKAVLLYALVMAAFGLTFAIELAVFIVGLLRGAFSQPDAASGAWIVLLFLILGGLLWLQRRLPLRVKNALCLHHLNLDGSAAGAEQLLVRWLLLCAYVLVTAAQLSDMSGMLAPENLLLPYFLLFLPLTQLTLSKGQYSLIDYALLVRAGHAQESDGAAEGSREAKALLAIIAAAVLAGVAVQYTKAIPVMSPLFKSSRSNPALVSAFIFSSFYNGGTEDAAPASASTPARPQFRAALEKLGLVVLQAGISHPGELIVGEGEATMKLAVEALIEVQVALPSLDLDAVKAKMQRAAQLACELEAPAAAAQGGAQRDTAIRFVVFGDFDLYHYALNKPFLCRGSGVPQSLPGGISAGFGFSFL